MAEKELLDKTRSLETAGLRSILMEISLHLNNDAYSVLAGLKGYKV